MEDAMIGKENSHIYALLNFHHPLYASRNMLLIQAFKNTQHLF